MPESVDTIIVGAGQAGLSVSSYLAKAGRDHLILERGEIAETWRYQIWESFIGPSHSSTENVAQRFSSALQRLV